MFRSFENAHHPGGDRFTDGEWTKELVLVSAES
jgi:hypothetical protein